MSNLAEVRKKVGLSQKQLAHALGWGQSRVANYELYRLPKVDSALQIVKVLNKFGAKTTVEKLFPLADKDSTRDHPQ